MWSLLQEWLEFGLREDQNYKNALITSWNVFMEILPMASKTPRPVFINIIIIRRWKIRLGVVRFSWVGWVRIVFLEVSWTYDYAKGNLHHSISWEVSKLVFLVLILILKKWHFYLYNNNLINNNLTIITFGVLKSDVLLSIY